METIRKNPFFLLVCLWVLVGSGCAGRAGLTPTSRPVVGKDAAAVEDQKFEVPSAPQPPGENTEDEEPADSVALEEMEGETPGAAPPTTEEAKGGGKLLFEGAKGASKSWPVPEETSGSEVLLNFDDADLSDVIVEFANMLGINYILDTPVSGKVTIHCSVPVDAKQLYPVFLQVLDANGLTAVQVGDLYHIGKSKDASRMPLVSRIGRSVDESGAGQRFVMQVVPLNFISCQEMSKLITPFISADGTVVTYSDSNILILVDKEINILKALKLVEVFDVDVFKGTNYIIYRLNFVDAAETASLVQEFLSSYGSGIAQETKILSVEKLNALIVFSKTQKVFDAIDSFLETLDVAVYNQEPQIYVYFVRNGQADDLAGLLQSVFSNSRSDTEKTSSQGAGEELTEAQQQMDNPFEVPSATKTKGEAVGSGSLRGEVKITPDDIRNALVIEAVPADYRIIENILNKLDVLPRQVLIEVTVAEVTLDDKLDLGVEWTYDYDESVSPSLTSVINSGISDEGLSFFVQETDRWTSTLSALASDKKVNILSSPSILASDNKTASINISTEIPVVTAQYETTGEAEPILTTNIQYRNTGVILSVTPHINEFGLVSMDISQEVSEEADLTTTVESLPAFFKRNVQTTLTVNNGQTIVIGGLISEKTSKAFYGVPILKDIPLLKYLFGAETDSTIKTELILMITPRVIASLEDVTAVTDEFKAKVKGIVKISSN